MDGSWFHRRKLYCEPWTEVVSHATPPHLLKVKINFDEARSGFISTPRCDHEKEHQRHAAVLVSRAFAFVFSWYKVIIALSLYFSSWAFQHKVHISIREAKIVSLEYFRAPIFGSHLRLARTKTAIPIRSVQNADCRLQTGYKMQTQNLYNFFVWYVITCHPTSYRASHNRFSVIIFDDYLYHCRIFLALFLITTVLKPSYSLLTLRASWLVWCLYRFYQRNKSRCGCRCKWDITIEYLTRATFEKQLTALHVVRIIIFLSGMCLFCWQKCGPRPKLFLRLDIFSTFRDVHTLIFTYVPYIVFGLHEEPASFYRERVIRTGDKTVYLDKFSIITNTLLMWMVCRGLTIFCRSGQIFERSADKICPG